MKLIKSTDPVEVKSIVLAIFSPPGVGKTSIANTAKNPLTVDFDKGSHRSAFRKDCLLFDSWPEAASEEFWTMAAGYDTIITDTTGRALDLLTDHLGAINPKNKKSDGNLSMSGYGALKATFTNWVKRAVGMGKDVIFLCHDKEDNQSDETVYRMDIQGGSYGEVCKLADGIGMLFESASGKRLDFSPRANHTGKNPANLPILEVPDFTEVPDFFAIIIDRIKKTLSTQTEAQREMIEKVDSLRERLASLRDKAGVERADGLNAVCAELKESDNKSFKAQARKLVMAAASQLELEFDKEIGAYLSKSPAETQGEQAPAEVEPEPEPAEKPPEDPSPPEAEAPPAVDEPRAQHAQDAVNAAVDTGYDQSQWYESEGDDEPF